MMPIAKRERANGPARGARASAASAGVHVDPRVRAARRHK